MTGEGVEGRRKNEDGVASGLGILVDDLVWDALFIQCLMNLGKVAAIEGGVDGFVTHGAFRGFQDSVHLGRLSFKPLLFLVALGSVELEDVWREEYAVADVVFGVVGV